MHAATSKDMVLSGDWITPTVNGEPFFDKPAFHNWLVALAFVVLGFTEFAARLPNAMLGLGCVLVTYLLGRRLYGPGAGFLGAVVLATTAEFLVLSRTVMHDMSLAFFVTLGLALWFVGYSKNATERRWFLLSYAAFGGAMLAKGPIGVLLPGAVVFLFLLVRRELRFLRRMSLGWGVLIGLLVAAPWYLAVSLRNPDYARYFFIELNFGSFLSKDPHHPEPFHYYLPVLLAGFFPWSFFLPAALVRAWQRRGEDTNGGTAVSAALGGVLLRLLLSGRIQARHLHPAGLSATGVAGRPALAGARHGADPGAPKGGALVLRTLPAAACGGGPLGAIASPAIARAGSPATGSPWKRPLRRWWRWSSDSDRVLLVLLRRTRAGFAGVALSFAACVALFFSLHRAGDESAPVVPRDDARAGRAAARGRAHAPLQQHPGLGALLHRPAAAADPEPQGAERSPVEPRPVYCVISASRYREMELRAPIVHESGDDLLISGYE